MSTLLYMDVSKYPYDFHWLDLSGSKPKPAAGKRIIHVYQRKLSGMCFVKHGNKKLVICITYEKGVFAYNAETDELEWMAVGEVPGMERPLGWFATRVTTDGRGHLFVGDDAQNCIHIFLVSDGSYIGCFEDMDMDEPYAVGWCEETSSLVCTARYEGKWSFVIFGVQY